MWKKYDETRKPEVGDWVRWREPHSSREPFQIAELGHVDFWIRHNEYFACDVEGCTEKDPKHERHSAECPGGFPQPNIPIVAPKFTQADLGIVVRYGTARAFLVGIRDGGDSLTIHIQCNGVQVCVSPDDVERWDDERERSDADDAVVRSGVTGDVVGRVRERRDSSWFDCVRPKITVQQVARALFNVQMLPYARRKAEEIVHGGSLMVTEYRRDPRELLTIMWERNLPIDGSSFTTGDERKFAEAQAETLHWELEHV